MNRPAKYRSSRSNSVPELPEQRLLQTPSSALLSSHAGLRRFYIHSQRRKPQDNFFVSFLELYRNFGGDYYPDFDEDDGQLEESNENAEETDAFIMNKNLDEPMPGQNSIGKTYFLILKAFVGTGILFLPKAYSNGGLVFSSFLLIFIAWIALYGMLLLVEVKNKEQLLGYSELGQKLFGNWMKYLIQIMIVLSQIGFCCAYTVFVAQNIREFFLDVSSCLWDIDVAYIIAGQMIIYIPLCLVRQVRYFSLTALVADIFILFGIGYVVIYDLIRLSNNGISKNIVYLNEKSFALFIGTAVFAYEGIGMILPINSAMSEPKKFSSVLTNSMIAISCTLLAVGILSYLAFGDDVQTVFLLNLPKKNGLVQSVQIFYATAIALTFPLMAFPALGIIESYVVPLSGRGNWKQKWKKNILRTILVIAMGFLSYLGASNLDRFVSLIGGLSCVPLSFIFPGMFHLKSLGSNLSTKIKDISLCIFGFASMIFITYITIYKWMTEGDDLPPGQCP